MGGAGYKDAVVLRLQKLEDEGWTVVYSDGSAKTVRGWAQAGYGVSFGPGSPRNHSAHMLTGQRQSVSWGEPRGLLHALLCRWEGEWIALVIDSEYVFKGVMEWLPKWQRHNLRTAGGEVGHRDLWEALIPHGFQPWSLRQGPSVYCPDATDSLLPPRHPLRY